MIISDTIFSTFLWTIFVFIIYITGLNTNEIPYKILAPFTVAFYVTGQFTLCSHLITVVSKYLYIFYSVYVFEYSDKSVRRMSLLSKTLLWLCFVLLDNFGGIYANPPIFRLFAPKNALER